MFFLGKSSGKLIFFTDFQPLSYKTLDIARDACLGENTLSGKRDMAFVLP